MSCFALSAVHSFRCNFVGTTETVNKLSVLLRIEQYSDAIARATTLLVRKGLEVAVESRNKTCRYELVGLYPVKQ